MTVLMKVPTFIVTGFGPEASTTTMSEKSTLPSSRPIGGMMTSLTRDATILPKATPMMMPTARSMTLPRMANSLNSLSIS